MAESTLDHSTTKVHHRSPPPLHRDKEEEEEEVAGWEASPFSTLPLVCHACGGNSIRIDAARWWGASALHKRESRRDAAAIGEEEEEVEPRQGFLSG